MTQVQGRELWCKISFPHEHTETVNGERCQVTMNTQLNFEVKDAKWMKKVRGKYVKPDKETEKDV